MSGTEAVSGTWMLPPSRSATTTSISSATSWRSDEWTPMMNGVGVDSTWNARDGGP